jgi:DNA-binding Xre family transcriptional regulator
MIRPVAETPDTVTLSRPDYEALLDALEDARDVAAAIAAEARVASGDSEFLPAEMVARLCGGEHPLRVWRQHRGLSARALAAAAGMAPSYLAEIETGRKTGSIDVLKRLARALDVTLDDLVAPDSGAAEPRDSAAVHEST